MKARMMRAAQKFMSKPRFGKIPTHPIQRAVGQKLRAKVQRPAHFARGKKTAR